MKGVREHASKQPSLKVPPYAGDQIDNLLYRLENGETPRKNPKVAVMLIGTNDYGAVDMCSGSDAGLLEAATNAARR